MSSEKKVTFLVASDINPRDGIGLETYIDGKLAMEIFRDDSERSTYVELFSGRVDLGVLKASIEMFNEHIDPDYLDSLGGPTPA